MKDKQVSSESVLFEIHRHIQLNIHTQEQLNKVIESVKLRRRDLARKVISELVPGDSVLVDSKGRLHKGTIRKINRTRAVVDMEGKGRYTVPFSLIRKG
jgi:hypothetical protein